MRGLARILREGRLTAYILRGRRWIILAVCMLMSLLLWFLFALANPKGYTKEIIVPVHWPVLPPEYIATDSTTIPETIVVQLHSSGFGLLSFTLKNMFQPVPVYTPEVEEALLDEAGGTWELTERQLKSQILTKILPSARSILSDTLRSIHVQPSSLNIQYEPLGSAEADVIFSSQVDFGEKPNLKLVNEVEIVPDRVTVYGAQSKLDSLAHAHALVVQTDTTLVRIAHPGKVRAPLALIPPTGTQVKPDSVIVSLTTEELTSRTFVVNNIAIEGLRPEYKIYLLPAHVRVTYLIAKTSTRDRIPPDLQLFVDASDVALNGHNTLPVQIRSFPKEVELIQLDPDRLSYIIEEKHVSTRP